MFKKLSDVWTNWCKTGIMRPYGYDPETNKPSITLMFFWITSFLSIISLILLHFALVSYLATGYSLLFVFGAFVMYRIRKLDKVKINVDEKSIELDNNEKKDENAEQD